MLKIVEFMVYSNNPILFVIAPSGTGKSHLTDYLRSKGLRAHDLDLFGQHFPSTDDIGWKTNVSMLERCLTTGDIVIGISGNTEQLLRHLVDKKYDVGVVCILPEFSAFATSLANRILSGTLYYKAAKEHYDIISSMLAQIGPDSIPGVQWLGYGTRAYLPGPSKHGQFLNLHMEDFLPNYLGKEKFTQVDINVTKLSRFEGDVYYEFSFHNGARDTVTHAEGRVVCVINGNGGDPYYWGSLFLYPFDVYLFDNRNYSLSVDAFLELSFSKDSRIEICTLDGNIPRLFAHAWSKPPRDVKIFFPRLKHVPRAFKEVTKFLKPGKNSVPYAVHDDYARFTTVFNSIDLKATDRHEVSNFAEIAGWLLENRLDLRWGEDIVIPGDVVNGDDIVINVPDPQSGNATE